MSESAQTAAPLDLEHLPPVRSSCAPPEVLARLETMSKRGRLAGFVRRGPDGFSAALFGQPFDYEVRGRVEPAAGGSEIRLAAAVLWKLPVIFIVVCIFTVWPGVWLTDRLIPGAWGWIPTWQWYLPLAIIPLPWMWLKWWRGSRAAAQESARELLDKLAAEFAGRG